MPDNSFNNAKNSLTILIIFSTSKNKRRYTINYSKIPSMKKILFSFCLLSSTLCFAQDYLDIIRLNVGRTNLEDLEQTFDTDITNVNLEILYPTPLTGKITMITGLTAENTGLELGAGRESQNLTMTRLNLGAKVSHSRKWTGTYLFLPKLASNFEGIGGADFQLGGIALMEYRFKSRKRGKFGLYSSSENFGTIVTPLIGGYYKSKNKKFYIDAALPIRMDANYSLAEKISVGADLRTSIKSYNLGGFDRDFYVQEESIRAALYFSYSTLDETLLLRAKAGLDTTDYGLYRANDVVGVQILTFQTNGDNRTRLNNEFDSSLFFGLDIIYRLGL